MAMKPLRLAVDTNVLLDLAAGVHAVLDTLAVLDERLPGHDIVVVPSVLDELAFLSDLGDTASVRELAQEAIRLVREEDRFRPLLDLACHPTFVPEVAGEIRSRKLLPSEEVHDSLILAEAAVIGCGLLLTSDEHLRGVDHELLTLVLNPFDLVPPVIASPKEIVSKFFR
jgi:predicted nucleic acid-binding protein